MLLFFRLPFVLLELLVRQGLRGLGTVIGLVRGHEAGDGSAAAGPAPGFARPAEEPAEAETGFGGDAGFGTGVEEPPAPPPPTAEEAIRRRRDREAVERVAPPVSEPEPPAPLHVAGEGGHVDSEPTLVESFGPSEEVAGTIEVDEPWEGYDGMPATAVVARLRGTDDATKAVVRLYEQAHKQRQTILRATG